jgi:hypothetical protein
MYICTYVLSSDVADRQVHEGLIVENYSRAEYEHTHGGSPAIHSGSFVAIVSLPVLVPSLHLVALLGNQKTGF